MILVAAPSFAATLAPFFRGELTPILDVACARLCGLGLQQQTRAPFDAPPAGSVVVTIVADRSASGARGPAWFHEKSLKTLLLGAPYIAIVAEEQDRDLYAEAASIAKASHSAIIVETDPQHRRAWQTFINRHASGRLRADGDAEPMERL